MCRLGFCVHECFNTQPPEGGWVLAICENQRIQTFQHTAARRRLGPQWADLLIQGLFQHTAARRRLGSGTSLSSRSPA